MLPTLRPGDRLLVKYGAQPRLGAVVVARFPDGAIVVKRVAERRGERWWLLSDNPDEGVDSRHRGAIAADQIVAVVRARVWPLYARLRSR